MSNPRTWRRRAARAAGLPQYLPDVVALAGQVGPEPRLHHVNVYHDDECSLLAGTGPCDCDPVVRLRGDPHDN